MFVDTHGHVQFNSFKDDGDATVKRAFEAGVAIVMPGSQIDTSRRAVEYAKRWNHPWLWAAVGLHPIHLEEVRVDEAEVENQVKFVTRKEEFDRDAYEQLLQSDKVVAIGEIGLDYWRRPKSKAKRAEYMQRQADTFIAQLDMAADHDLPTILHCRVAHDDMLDILKNHRQPRLRPACAEASAGRQGFGGQAKEVAGPGVVHSYTGDLKQLDAFLSMGYCIGVNGLVFKLDFVQEAVKACPLERIVLETDAPYLTPPLPRLLRQQAEKAGCDPERNEPAFLPLIAAEIARLKNISPEEVERQTTENAQALFRVNFGLAG
ncbi:MAG: TatD family hydrolase [Candidatus Spechtbacterales bacterium]